MISPSCVLMRGERERNHGREKGERNEEWEMEQLSSSSTHACALGEEEEECREREKGERKKKERNSGEMRRGGDTRAA